MKIGVIDFSSSALSLLVAEVSGDRQEPVIGLRRSVSILDYMTKKGRLSGRGIEKVVDSVRELVMTAEKVGAERVVLVATASMRLLTNYREVSDAVEEATGLCFDILDGKDEAYADYAANMEYAALGDALLLDIGGVTSEIADLDNPDRESMFSLPIGPMSLYRHAGGMYPDREEAKLMSEEVRSSLERELVYPGAVFKRIVLVGGNAEALYSVYNDYFSLPESSHRVMKRKKLKKLLKHLVSSEERSMLIIKNAPEKVHVLIPAAVLALSVAKHFEAKELIISDKGVKEGYLRLIAEEKNVHG